MKSREERRTELQSMLHTDAGKAEILSLYKASQGMDEGMVVTPGALLSTMVEAILDAENLQEAL